MSASIFPNFHFYWLWLCEHEIWWKHRKQMPTQSRFLCCFFFGICWLAESGLKRLIVYELSTWNDVWCRRRKKHWEKDGKDAWRVLRLRSIYVDFVWLSRAARPERVCAQIGSESESQQRKNSTYDRRKWQQRQRQHFSYSLIRLLLAWRFLLYSYIHRISIQDNSIYRKNLMKLKHDDCESYAAVSRCWCRLAIVHIHRILMGRERELWKRRLVWIFSWVVLACWSSSREEKKYNTKRGKSKQKMNFD